MNNKEDANPNAHFIIEEYMLDGGIMDIEGLESDLENEINDRLSQNFMDVLKGTYSRKYNFNFDWIEEAFPEEEFLTQLHDDHSKVIINGKRGPFYTDVTYYPLSVRILNRETKPNQVITFDEAAGILLGSDEATHSIDDYVRDDIPKVIEMITKTRDKMRDICNDKGLSCKDSNGEFLPVEELAELIDWKDSRFWWRYI